ncbi:hypothetical protein FA13DRAFT_285536 [Coprinellus micaceus]|uniref:Uncharacterized protein n=1 Tax=Coprinellus micaceus TaxID=71717 RepID=A0A4Y7TDQ0_COPMI|nr:hypothetical protein FA13DRAFT_285536 [Coprinellus micaceus]
MHDGFAESCVPVPRGSIASWSWYKPHPSSSCPSTRCVFPGTQTHTNTAHRHPSAHVGRGGIIAVIRGGVRAAAVIPVFAFISHFQFSGVTCFWLPSPLGVFSVIEEGEIEGRKGSYRDLVKRKSESLSRPQPFATGDLPRLGRRRLGTVIPRARQLNARLRNTTDSEGRRRWTSSGRTSAAASSRLTPRTTQSGSLSCSRIMRSRTSSAGRGRRGLGSEYPSFLRYFVLSFGGQWAGSWSSVRWSGAVGSRASSTGRGAMSRSRILEGISRGRSGR